MTRRSRSAAVAGLLLALVVVGCTAAPPGTPGTPDAPGRPGATPGGDGIELAIAQGVTPLATTAEDAAKAGDAVNAFGLDLYRQLVAADPTADLVISPASIELALAMARAGARGATADEMDRVMHGLGSDAAAAAVAALQEALANRTTTVKDAVGEDHDVILRVVNATFAQRGYPISPSYLEALAGRFAAGLRLVDYRENPEGSRRAINAWVAEQTEDRIRELLAEGTIDEDTRLALVNAIYLKAAWQTPFSPDATSNEPFTSLDGTSLTVPTMHERASMAYADGEGWQAVELPYVGGKLAMMLVLPDDLAAFEGRLDGSTFASIPAALERTDVVLALPKFSIDTQASLADTLAAMGMPTPFTDRADFTGITTEDPLQITAVVHQANIDLDEAGTEAAAATAVIVGVTSAPADPVEPIELTFDHPFLFALRDQETGAALFLGRVTAPEWND